MARLQVHQRRQAHPGARVAADVHSCTNGNSCAVFSPFPPHPPTKENPAAGGQTGRGKGRAIAIFYAGVWRVLEKPGDCPPQPSGNPHGCKQNGLTGFSQNPRVGVFCPRVYRFLPRVGFCGLPPLSHSLSQISEERGERAGPKGGKWPSTGLQSGYEMYPRVHSGIHGFSGDEKLSNLQWWQGLSPGGGGIHGFCRRNACTPTVNRMPRGCYGR